MNVCLCGSYSATFATYVTTMASQPASSLTNTILWQQIERIMLLNADFFRCSEDCSSTDAFISGYYAKLNSEFGSATANALSSSYTAKETTLKTLWADVVTQASASAIIYCTLAQKFGAVMVEYTTYLGGDGSTTNAASHLGSRLFGISLLLLYLFA